MPTDVRQISFQTRPKDRALSFGACPHFIWVLIIGALSLLTTLSIAVVGAIAHDYSSFGQIIIPSTDILDTKIISDYMDQTGIPTEELLVADADTFLSRTLRVLHNSNESGVQYVSIILETGWPFRCLHGEQWPSSGNWRPAQSTIWCFSIGESRVSIPMGIKSGGLILNVCIWAGMLSLISLCTRTLRRILRQRRNNCIRCGYQLGHTTSSRCSECGWNSTSCDNRSRYRLGRNRGQSPKKSSSL